MPCPGGRRSCRNVRRGRQAASLGQTIPANSYARCVHWHHIEGMLCDILHSAAAYVAMPNAQGRSALLLSRFVVRAIHTTGLDSLCRIAMELFATWLGTKVPMEHRPFDYTAHMSSGQLSIMCELKSRITEVFEALVDAAQKLRVYREQCHNKRTRGGRMLYTVLYKSGVPPLSDVVPQLAARIVTLVHETVYDRLWGGGRKSTRYDVREDPMSVWKARVKYAVKCARQMRHEERCWRIYGQMGPTKAQYDHMLDDMQRLAMAKAL